MKYQNAHLAPGPWLPICTGQAVRYCFANTRSQTNLEPIFNQAVAKWAHDFLNSALEIVPDNEEALLCTDPGVRANALIISTPQKTTIRNGTLVQTARPTVPASVTTTTQTTAAATVSNSATTIRTIGKEQKLPPCKP
jgi:hypothetical protein